MWGAKVGIIAVRPSSLGPFEITSDLDSKIEEYTARRNLHLYAGLMWLPMVVAFATMPDMLPVAVVFIAIGIPYIMPVSKYSKLIKRLKEERATRET